VAWGAWAAATRRKDEEKAEGRRRFGHMSKFRHGQLAEGWLNSRDDSPKKLPATGPATEAREPREAREVLKAEAFSGAQRAARDDDRHRVHVDLSQTGQPDFGTVIIEYVPRLCASSPRR